MSDRQLSIEKVKLAKKTFALAFLAFWALMTNHCALEFVPGFDLFACSPQEEATPHQPTDCGDEDACATIESGLYKSEQSHLSAGKAPVVSVAFALALLSPPAALERAASQVSPEATPPELAHTWHFSFRTALPPRAPSLVS